LGQCEFNKGKVKLQKISFKKLYLGKDFEAKNLSKSMNKGMLLGPMIVNVLHGERWHEILGG
jgi:hypothetical protein